MDSWGAIGNHYGETAVYTCKKEMYKFKVTPQFTVHVTFILGGLINVISIECTKYIPKIW